MVNISTATARHIIEILLDYGVEDVVVAPGSRSAPLAIALAQLAESGDIRLHVRIDERDAGFLALGLAKASQRLVPVVVTSGTAVANLYPAVVEAYHSAIPIVVLSADRPASSRGKSAPQIIDQAHLFGHFAKVSLDLEPSVADFGLVTSALEQALTSHRGPVHINVQFDLPLVPDPETLQWNPQIQRVVAPTTELSAATELELPSHGVVVVGSLEHLEDAQQAKDLAHQLGWPIISEPSANVHDDPNSIAHGVLLLASGALPIPEAVVTVGTVGLSRPVLQLLRDAKTYIAIHSSGQGPDVPDPVQCVQQVVVGFPRVSNQVDAQWLSVWQEEDRRIGEIVASELSGEWLTGPSAAVTLWNQMADSSQLLVAASWPVRHLEAYASNRNGVRVFGNRGVNGIDGLISTAWGVATTSSNRTYLLIGDIAFLHDIGGLNVAGDEAQPNLTVVVLDNDGGGIFSQLEQGAPAYAGTFEKIFGTPHNKDLWQITESFGYAATRVTTTSELAATLASTDKISGIHVVICMTGSRDDEVALLRKISSQVSR